MDNYDCIRMQNPLLVIGVGGVGAKLVPVSKNNLGCDCMLISNDKKDLSCDSYNSVFIDSQPWLNPSNHRIRSIGIQSEAEIRSYLDAYSTIFVIANLAGRCGTAIAPLISKLSKENPSRTVISFVIMPFGFEKDRIFQAGISLRRLKESSDAIVVIDNDALLNNNPDLSLKECYEITNNAISEVISMISNTPFRNSVNLLCTGRPDSRSAESSVKDCLAMLYENADSSSIKMATLYLVGGTDLSVGRVNYIVNTLQEIFKQEDEIGVSLATPHSPSLKVHLLAAVHETTRFDKYDPLAELIPLENVLDWEEMESSPEIKNTIPNLE